MNPVKITEFLEMKIVRIIARLNVGGPARHVVWLTKSLQDTRFQSVLITGTVPEGEEDMSYFAFENGVFPVVIPEMSRELSLKDFFSFLKIYRVLLREKPDIIHTHTAKAGTLGRLAGFLYRWFTWRTLIGRPRRVKLVHTYHGHIFHSYYGHAKTKFFLLIEKVLAFLATDKIVVISQKQFEEIHKQFGVGRSSQFVVIPLGIDLEPFSVLKEKSRVIRKEFSIENDELASGIVGRLTEIKNHKLFLQAAKLCKERGAKFKFIVIGDGHLRKSLEDFARSLGLFDDTVIFAGNRNDISFYAGLDIVALTSLNEGTPLSLIEAMASGIPCVATMVGGVVDLLGKVLSEKNGFLICERGIGVLLSKGIPAQNFCEGLLFLSNDSELRREISKNGHDFILSNYSKERLTRDIRQLYEELFLEKGKKNKKNLSLD